MICVDASVAAKWVFEEPYYQQARDLYRTTVHAGERVVAPALLPTEVTNIIRQYMRRVKPPRTQPLTLAEASAALQQFLAFPVELLMPPSLHQQALELTDAHGLPAVYDAHYIALAQMLSCAFWTADQKLTNTLGSTLPFVRWIGDY